MLGGLLKLFRGQEKPQVSDEQKEATLAGVFGGEAPDYAWYNAGRLKRLSPEQIRAIESQTRVPQESGNIELHGGGNLRIRNAKTVPVSLDLVDRTASLYKAYHSGWADNFPTRNEHVYF